MSTSSASPSARPPCSAPASWARRSPRTSPTPASRSLLFDLPAKEGDPNGLVAKAHRRPRASSSPRRSRPRIAPRAIEAAQLRQRPRAARRMRPRDRGDRRAPRLEARPLREDRAASRAARDRSRRTRRDCRSPRCRRRCRRRCAPRFCGMHFFNPPRYMHLVELIPAPQTDAGAARRARDVPDHDARQGRDPREGHAELHRQPHRHLLGAGDDAAHARRSALASTSSTR